MNMPSGLVSHAECSYARMKKNNYQISVEINVHMAFSVRLPCDRQRKSSLLSTNKNPTIATITFTSLHSTPLHTHIHTRLNDAQKTSSDRILESANSSTNPQVPKTSRRTPLCRRKAGKSHCLGPFPTKQKTDLRLGAKTSSSYS
jgi:hypothetical protein